MVDNYALWEAQEIKKEQWLARLPKCDICKDPIQDEKYHKIHGENICNKCLADCEEENTFLEE